jgi:hypothetical protein
MISTKIASIIAAAAFAAGSFFAPPVQQAIAAVIATDVQCTGCVGTADLAGNAVTSAKIKDQEVKTEDIAMNAIGSARIRDNEVKAQDIAPDAVGSSKIADGAITYGDVSRNFIAVEHRDDCNCGGTGWDPDGTSSVELIYDSRITPSSVVAVTGLGFGITCTTYLNSLGYSGYVAVKCTSTIPNGMAINYSISNPA